MARYQWQDDQDEGGEVTTVATIDTAVALTAADKAAIDVQVATAKAYPRNIEKSIKEAIRLSTFDEDTAVSMHYALPRKAKGGKTVFIEGPSVRAAEILVYSWGNIRAESRIVGVDDTHVTAQGTCMDLEKNIGARVEIKRRITDSAGRRFNDDMIVVTGNAAASIAFRNAVFRVIPAALAKRVFDAAKKMATGGAQPIEARRQRALQWFARVGAPETRVLELLEIGSVDEITEEHLQTLNGLRTAIQEGTTTVEEAFSRGNSERPQTEATSKLNDVLGESKPAATSAGSAPPPPPPPGRKGSAQVEAARKILLDALERHELSPVDSDVQQWMAEITGRTGDVAEMTAAEMNKVVQRLEADAKGQQTPPASEPQQQNGGTGLFDD